MRRKISLFSILLLLVVSLVGCDFETIETEVDVITMRPYSEIKQSGLIAVKEQVHDYIEYTFEYNGKIYLEKTKTIYLEVGEKTAVIVTEFQSGDVLGDLQLSLEDYKKLYGMDDAENDSLGKGKY